MTAPNWISYAGAHHRVRRSRGPARAFTCSCGATAEEWAYDHLDLRELVHQRNPAGKSMRYSANPAHYIAMCRKCHAAFDRQQRGEKWRRRLAAKNAEAETGDREQGAA